MDVERIFFNSSNSSSGALPDFPPSERELSVLRVELEEEVLEDDELDEPDVGLLPAEFDDEVALPPLADAAALPAALPAAVTAVPAAAATAVTAVVAVAAAETAATKVTAVTVVSAT
jgi:hypothetical protein